MLKFAHLFELPRRRFMPPFWPHEAVPAEEALETALSFYAAAVHTLDVADELVHRLEAWKYPNQLNLARQMTLDSFGDYTSCFEECIAYLRRARASETIAKSLRAELAQLKDQWLARWPEVNHANYEQVLADNYDRWVGGELPVDMAQVDSAMARAQKGETSDLKDVIRELQGSD